MANARKSRTVAVVGAVNVDINGVSHTKLIYGDSNPGKVSLTLGGVGRNIAETLMRLGFGVTLITAIGDDKNAELVKSGCQRIGLDISHSLEAKGISTSTYLCLSDCDGEIAVAVNDMTIYERLTPEFLKSKLDILNASDLVVLDANIPASSVEFLARNCLSPIVADPVSVKKAGRIKSSLGSFAFIKPNCPEATVLTGVEIHSDGDLARAAKAFFDAGLKRVFISLGSRGVYFSDGGDCGIFPCYPSKTVNTTGCGDAFLAGAAAGLLQGLDIKDMARMGLACSSVCAASEKNVWPEISMESIKSIINES